jgi:hypothetical protein
MDIKLRGKCGGLNNKSINMAADKRGIERSLTTKFPNFAVTFNLLHRFLGGRLLGERNIAYAAQQLRRFREHPAFCENLDFIKEIDLLDARLNAAKDRFKRRTEWRIAQKYEAAQAKVEGRKPRKIKEFGEWKPGGQGRPPKNQDEPTAVTIITPETDPWSM